jgi:hypothetical protein
MLKTLRDIATEQLDAFTEDLGPPSDRDAAIVRWMRHLAGTGQVPDDILEAMPEISRHDEQQVSPQEYDCGCLATTRITDREYRYGEKPFEMRLAIPCDGARCELPHLRETKA